MTTKVTVDPNSIIAEPRGTMRLEERTAASGHSHTLIATNRISSTAISRHVEGNWQLVEDSGEQETVMGSLPWVHEQLDELLTLEEDYDSYGAYPPTLLSVFDARRLIDEVVRKLQTRVGDLAIAYELDATPRGGVLIEWRGESAHLTVEIGPDSTFSYLLKIPTANGWDHEELHNVTREALWRTIERALHA